MSNLSSRSLPDVVDEAARDCSGGCGGLCGGCGSCGLTAGCSARLLVTRARRSTSVVLCGSPTSSSKSATASKVQIRIASGSSMVDTDALIVALDAVE
jgi:hypothetical protein